MSCTCVYAYWWVGWQRQSVLWAAEPVIPPFNRPFDPTFRSTRPESTHPSHVSCLTTNAPCFCSSSFTVIPGGPERIHRAGLESIVSSSRFRLRSVAPWAHTAPGAAYSSIDLDADRNLLAVGTISGALGVMTTGLESASVGGGGGDRPGRGFAQWRSGARQQEERVCWANAASWASGQVGLVFVSFCHCPVYRGILSEVGCYFGTRWVVVVALGGWLSFQVSSCSRPLSVRWRCHVHII